MLVASLVFVFLIVFWVIQRGRNPPAAGPAEPQQRQVMQPVQETNNMQNSNSEMVLFLPKGSRRDLCRTYRCCLVTRKCATMAPHSASEYGARDGIFASAVPEDCKLDTMRNSTIVIN